MSNPAKRLANTVRGIYLAFEGASEVANAVRNHRKPNTNSLRKLGIDPSILDGHQF